MDATVKEIQPGVDDASHGQSLHQSISESLAAVLKVPPESIDTKPPVIGNPISQELADIMQKPAVETSLEDVLAGEKGQPRTDPSKNFLATLFRRLRRQSHQSDKE